MANNLKGLTIKIGADTTALNSALANVNKSTKNLQKELKQVDKLLKLDPGNTELLKQKQDILTQSIAETKQKLDTLREAEKQVQEQFERGEIGEEQYRALQREIVETEQKLESLEAEAKEFGSVSAQVAKATGEKFKEAGEKISGVGKNLSKGVTAPILAIGAASVAAFKEVDDALDIVVTKTGATGEAMDGLKESFNNVYKSVPVEASEVGNAIGELNTQFALTGTALEEATTAMIQFAQINGTDVTSATISAKQAIEAYGMEATDLDKVLDAVTVTAQATGVSVDKLFDAAVKGAPTIKALGLDFAQAVTILGGFEQKGIDSSKALTYLQKAQIALAKEGRTLGEGLGEVVTAIMNCETEADKLSLASEYFGTKGAVFMLDALERGALDFDNLGEAAANAAGTVSTTFEETLDPIDKATLILNNLKIAGAELAGSLMTALAPILEAIIEKVQKFTDWFTQLDEGTQQTIITIAGIVAAVGPLLVVIGSVMSAVGTIITMVPAIVTGITAVGTAINTALGPIGWIAMAIGAVVAVLITLWNTNEDFRNAVIAIWEGIKNFFVTTAETIKAVFVAAWEGIKAVWNGVVGFFTNIWEGIKAVFAVVAAVLSGDFGTAAQLIYKVFEPVISFFQGVWEKIKAVFANVGEHFRDIGARILEGIWNGISDKIAWLKSKVTGVVDKIKSWFTGPDALDERSPSHWAEKVGAYVDSGLAKGLLKNMGTIKKAATVVTGGVMKPLEMLDLPDLEKNLAYSVLAPGSVQPEASKTAATEAVTGAITTATYSTDDTAQQIADAVSAALQTGLATLADTLFAAMPKDVILQINAKQIARATWSAFEAEARSRNRLFAPTRGQVVRLVNGGGV